MPASPPLVPEAQVQQVLYLVMESRQPRVYVVKMLDNSLQVFQYDSLTDMLTSIVEWHHEMEGDLCLKHISERMKSYWNRNRRETNWTLHWVTMIQGYKS